ncbi:translation initiation factor IF-2 [Paenibacillus swuensis]|uniref:Translation initiation factor IF-2 n=1 Tax=Paenibacillus swuensis TaxID=1178515 RepID=A0A172TL87_9BACL|nr:translation initiation factor IF-2 [Paenibacillus swuensis]ANE47577.1 translation initiation factor IF-2 [Paenibacillus swuensis]
MSKQDKDNKDKLRVYEYAKSLNMSSKEIITILKRLDLPVNNHMSVMENDSVSRVEGFFRDIKANAAAKRATETSSKSSQQAPSKTADKSVASSPSQPKQEDQPKTTISSASRDVSSPATGASSGSGNSTQDRNNDRNQGERRSQPTERQGHMNSTRSNDRNSSGNYNQNRTGTSGTGTSTNRTGQSTTGTGSQSGGQRTYSGQSSTGGARTYSGQGSQGGQGSRTSSGTSSQSGGRTYSGQGSQGGGQRTSSTGQGGQGAGRSYSGQGSQGGQGQGGGNRFGNSSGSGAPRSSQPARPAFGSSPAPASGGLNQKQPNRKSTKPTGKRFEDGKPGGFGGGNRNNGFNRNNKGKGRHQSNNQEKREKIDNTPKKIIVRGNMTVGEMAKSLHKDASEVIKKLMSLGTMATINQELDLDAIQLLAGDFGVEVEIKIAVEEDRFENFEESDEAEDLMDRPPVVTIMGHVDHGKTTLLDAIRETNVTGGEAGGITQHIGAYQVEVHGKKITFLDTPGHEAFTSMRARGAQVTDITILVVAADDGVMPQTVEAINHAKAAKVPIIVAINKIDKEGANPDRIKQDLTEYELVPEEWGGDTIFVEVSAKQRLNLEGLLETILLIAEVNEYKANPNKRARGTVIEAELDKGRGAVARVLIQHGTLKVGDAFIAGVYFGRVRTMVNDKGRRLKEAGPSTPIEITGLTDVPLAGDPFIVFEDERKARDIAEKRAVSLRQSEMTANTRVTLEDMYQHIKDGELKELNVIIKADVHGSSEAMKSSLQKIEVEGARVRILHSGVGAITESDITLAAASNAIIIGFNVRPETATKATADQEKVDIRLHNVIYNAIEEIEAAMKGLLDPIFKETIIGHAEVRNIFKIGKVGTIAGCMVTDGKITRASQTRVLRGGTVVFTGKIDTLKRFKDDAKEVAQGYECGITVEKFNDIKEGDIIEAFIMETVER